MPVQEPRRRAANYEEPIFPSAHAALAFAFGYSPDQYAPSVMAKLIQGGVLGNGKGLVGMDGAGQAGMILAEVHELGPAAENFLAARFAPHTVDCPCRRACCTGRKPALAFVDGIYWIAHESIQALSEESRTRTNYRLRRGLVLRFFGERENMSELAKFAGVSRDTASQRNAELLPWLKHNEGAAMHAAIVRLKEVGMVA
jgi:hypothetical protein